ncbi:hypothetical protein FISHEDRAFT_37457 [Fistulina hepatica ATCC 64428]|uniref:DUF1275 domain protein n=1 Tax=Fistulina hepatica ATCC 64428 TaxID=1128425 RepID=A0A0D7AJB1_9AGAR|nr:hypothetical protein FISHEDRAFT_37457 [Fistulina hepatica ATCC 64428]
MSTASTPRNPDDLTNKQLSKDLEPISLWSYLCAEVDTKRCSAPLTAYYFMTGFLCAMSFSSTYVWCGFQTGNYVQLSLAIARLFEDNDGVVDHTFHKSDQQALCSLLAFNCGAFCGRLGDHYGPKKRAWLISGTFVQTLLTMGAAITIWKSGQPSIASERGNPSWTNALTFVGLAFMSASLGVQGVLAKRLNTPFGATIVLTTIWIELMSDPRLFTFRQRVVGRDNKLLAVVGVFIGGFTSRALLAAIGSAATLGIATGIRLMICFWWLFVPSSDCGLRLSQVKLR